MYLGSASFIFLLKAMIRVQSFFGYYPKCEKALLSPRKTDAADPGVSERVGAGHLILTSCPSDHSRQALCCKMQAEFDHFLLSDKR
jgi:hypothetical protein